MFVLGVDPGLTRCGYGVVEARPSGPVAVAAGVIRTAADLPVHRRLGELQRELRSLLGEHRPTAVAVERVFFQVNVRTAMSVGQASGVILAEAAAAGVDVAEYTPTQVKNAVAGWGAAPKEQVQRMVQAQLGLESPPRPADAADALALALCHLAHAPLRRSLAAAGVERPGAATVATGARAATAVPEEGCS